MNAQQIALGSFLPGVVATIALGATESSPIKAAGMVPVSLSVPAIFTGTALTFLVGDSEDGYQANGVLIFTGVGTDGDTVAINGVTITLVDADPTGSEVLIGATAAETAENLYDFLAATEDADLLECTYALNGATVTVTAVEPGTDGNSITFVKTSTGITISGSGTLIGGGFRPLYNPSNSLISMTVAAGRTYAIDPAFFSGLPFFKIKSGTTETADRTIYCALKGM